MNRRFFLKSLAAAVGSLSAWRVCGPLAQTSPAILVAPLRVNLSGAGRIGFYIDYSERDTAGTHTFYVCRTHGTSGSVSVDYSTQGDIHGRVSGTLNWSDGEADIKSFSVHVTNTDLSTHDGLGEHRIVATLSNPGGGVALQRGAYTRAYGVIDNDSMVASDENALFVDFDATVNGNGTRSDPFNNWYDARDAWGATRRRYIYGKGTAIPDGSDSRGSIRVFDEEGTNGALNGASDTDRLIIRNWPSESWIISGNGARDTAGFYVESGGDYVTWKGISFDGLDTTGIGSAPNQCFGVWLNRSCIMPTVEHCSLTNIASGAISGTGALYLNGGPLGVNIWRTVFANISKSNGTLPNGIEQYDGGSTSIQRCDVRGCSIYEKDSPDAGEVGMAVKFCICDEMIRLSGLGFNPSGSYHIVQANLLRQSGNYDNPALRMDGGSGAVGNKHWIVGNVFDNCGGDNCYPILSEHDAHSAHIIFNNIFYRGRGVWRLSSTEVDFEYSDHNHEYSVATTGSWRYHYQGREYATTDSMNSAEGWEARMGSGDPLFQDIANGNVSLQVGSPCLGSGVGGTHKGIYLAGVESLGADSGPLPNLPPPGGGGMCPIDQQPTRIILGDG